MPVESAKERLGFLGGPVLTADFMPPNPEDNGWSFNDSSFQEYFGPVKLRGQSRTVLDLIEEQLGFNTENVGLDIAGGASGVALRGLMDHGLIGRGLVTNLADKRDGAAIGDPRLDHLAGNLLLGSTWHKLIEWVDTNTEDGASLILHRPMGGMQEFTPSFYQGAIHTVLDMMAPGGVMFTQVPSGLKNTRAVMNMTSPSLEAVCRTVTERPDVAEVIPQEMPFNTDPHHTLIVMK